MDFSRTTMGKNVSSSLKSSISRTNFTDRTGTTGGMYDIRRLQDVRTRAARPKGRPALPPVA